MSPDIDRVGRTHPGNVNEYGVRPDFREVRNPAWFGVETSDWKGFLLRFAGDRTVTEVSDARNHDGSAVIAMRMRLDLGCRISPRMMNLLCRSLLTDASAGQVAPSTSARIKRSA